MAKSSLVRKLAWIMGGLLVLLIIAFFVITRSGFIKAMVLPRVGQAMNATVEADTVSLSPFSQIILRGVRIKTIGPEPLLQAEEIRVGYRLFSILGGRIELLELKLAKPSVHVAQNADGTSNLDPLFKKPSAPPAPGAAPSPAKPMQLAIKNVSLSQGVIRWSCTAKTGERQSAEITGINLALDQLRNGQPGKLTLEAGVKYEVLHPAIPGQPSPANDMLQANATGSYEFKVSPDLTPQSIAGSTRLVVSQALGAYKEAATLNLVLECQITPAEIQQLALRFERGGSSLGQLRVSGPMDLSKKEGRLKIELLSLDRQVLNLAGASRGWDFGTTVINASNLVDIAGQGKVILASGKLTGSQVGLRMKEQATPLLDLAVGYRVDVNLNKQNAIIHQLAASAKRNAGDLLSLNLDRPMALAWGAETANIKESVVSLSLTNLDLQEWGFLAGDLAPRGRISASGRIVSQQDGRQIFAEFDVQAGNLSARVGSNSLSLASVRAQLTGKLEDFDKATVDKCRFEAQDGAQTILSAEGSATYGLKSGEANVRLAFEGRLPALLQKFPVPGLTASAGMVKGSGLVNQRANGQSFSGTLSLDEFTGRCEPYAFDKYQANVDYNVEVKGSQVQVSRLNLSARQNYEPGGSLDLSGIINLQPPASPPAGAPANAMPVKSAQLAIAMLDLNQRAVNPFLAPSLAPRTLASVTLNLPKTTVVFDPQGESSLKGDLKIANLVVTDPQAKTAPKPLNASLQIDGQFGKNVLELKQCILGLDPTERAANSVQLTGRMDLTLANAASGQWVLRSDSLDVTPWYEMFSGGASAPATNAAVAAAKPAAAAAEVEPQAMKLPVDNLNVEARIGRLYLKDLAITNLQMTAKIAHNEVTVKPAQMILNGAPVQANAIINVGVPGYIYDVSLQGDKIPMEPLGKSFTTGSGQYQGNVFLNAQIKGAGITGPNLQKNLSGQSYLNVTNANILLKPTGFVNLALKSVLTILQMPELLEAPITGMESQTKIGAGKVELQKFALLSSAYQARSQGAITLAPVLNNSTLDLPVTLMLSSNVAQKASLYPTNAPTNATFVALPQFVKIAGTVGKPDYQVDKWVLASILAKNLSGLSSVISGLQTNALGTVTNLLSGKSSNALGNVLSGLLGGSKSGASTNASGKPDTNAAPQTNRLADTLVQGLGSILSSRSSATTTNQASPAKTNAPADPKAAPAKTNAAPAKTADTNATNSPLNLLNNLFK